MNYKRNEQGEVAVRDIKGNLKYITQRLAEDKQLMKSMHFEVVQAPEPFVIEEKKQDESFTLKAEEAVEVFKDAEKTALKFNEQTEVAETTPAKRGRKPNQQ